MNAFERAIDENIKKNTLIDKFEEFKNNVFCRRNSNQHKAEKIWREISAEIPKVDRDLFRTEWSHYMLGEFDADEFGEEVKRIEKYLIKRQTDL